MKLLDLSLSLLPTSMGDTFPASIPEAQVRRIREVANAVQWISTHKQAMTEADSWPLPNKAETDIKTNISRFLKDVKRNPSRVMPASSVQLPAFMCCSIHTFGTWAGKRRKLCLETWSCFQKVSSKLAIPCLLFHWSAVVCLAP